MTPPQASEAAVGGRVRYQVWDADYYDSEARMFPHDHEVHGPIEADDEADLIRKLEAKGLDPKNLRWEELEATP